MVCMERQYFGVDKTVTWVPQKVVVNVGSNAGYVLRGTMYRAFLKIMNNH